MNNYPKITIVTPNYNCDKFLEQTILSVINQNYPNLEYIIIDGGSSDKSIEIIKKYEKYLTYWISEPDSGMYEAIQKGFEKSTGEIMAWINSDDMYHNKSFFTVAEIFSNFKEIKWLTGANTNYDELGRTIFTRYSYEHNKFSQYFEPTKHIQQESTFWRKELWQQSGSRLDTSLKYAGDFELWLRFNKYSQLYITDALIGGFRSRKNQTTQLFMNKYIKECSNCLEEYKKAFSPFERKIFDEILSIKEKIIFNKENKEYLEEKVKTLSKTSPKIYFDKHEQKFKLQGNNMSNVYNIIKDRRDSKKAFLEMLKYKFDFYPDLILDVGVAQGTKELYETFPESHIILFEPVIEFENFLKEIENSYPKVSTEMCALGEKEDTLAINVHPDLVGSSLYLEDEDSNVNGIPRNIDLKPLDSFSNKYNFPKQNGILLKIDVQGAELDVLKGAKKTMSFVDIVILEASFFNFFNNNVLITDIIKYMDEIGFELYDIFDFLNRPLDGALAQVDIAFVKKNSKFKTYHKFATKEQRNELNSILKKDTPKIPKTQTPKKIVDFTNSLNSILKKIEVLDNSNKTFVIYGNGTVGKTIQALIPNKIAGFVDMADENNHPKNLLDMKYDKILISVLGREEEIIKYLVEELNINREKIITLEI